MQWTTPSKSRSPIVYVFITVILLFSGAQSFGADQACKAKASYIQECRDHDSSPSSSPPEPKNKFDDCLRYYALCPESDSSGGTGGDSECSSLRTRYFDARKTYADRCADGGVSQGCDKVVKGCQTGLRSGSDGDSAAENRNAVLTSLATSFGVSERNGAGGMCSSISGRDFEKQQKDLKNETEKLQDNITKNKENLVRLDEDYNKSAAEMDKEANALKAKHTEETAKMPAALREQQKKLDDLVTKYESDKREKEKAKLIQSNRLSDVLANKAKQLAKLAVSKEATTCYQQALTVQKSMPKTAAKSKNEYISSSGGVNSLAQRTYADCLDEFQNQRLDLLRTTDQQLQDIHHTVDSLQADVDGINDSLVRARQEVATFKLEQAQSLTAMTDKANKELEVMSKSRIALDQNKTTKGTQLTQEQTRLEGKLKEAEGKLMALESNPPKSTSDVNVQKVYSAYQTAEDAKAAYSTHLVHRPTDLPGKKTGGCPPLAGDETKEQKAQFKKDKEAADKAEAAGSGAKQ